VKNKKRLLIVNGNQFGYSAGHYYYCLYLHETFEVNYICFDKGRKKMEISDVNVCYISIQGNKITRTLRFIWTSISMSKKISPDFLMVVYFNFSFILSLFCKSKETILDIRTGSLDKNSFKRNLGNRIIKFQSFFFTKRIILSESLLNELRISSKNTLIMPLGSEIYFSGKHDYKNLNLLYVGSLDGRKITDTIEGIALLLKDLPNYKSMISYKIIGFGSNLAEKEIKDLINKNKLNSIIKFEGLKNYNELPLYFSSCNVGVAYVPITDYYQFQPLTKVFEYCLSGQFIIGTDTYENRKFITSENGLICKDNPKSFSEALMIYFQINQRLNSTSIRKTLIDYNWKTLVEKKLRPFFEKNSGN